MWVFTHSTGIISHNDIAMGVCYSGNGAGLNNTQMQNVFRVGPIPVGMYTIGKFYDDAPGPNSKGPVVADLEPDEDNVMYGRSGFMIHGDNKAMNHTASDGCIIAPRFLRACIADSNDNRLVVRE